MIKATLPVVGANIGQITELFYQKLFNAAPVLETDVFNRSNQARGEQQKALAGSIAKFATLLVSDDDIDPRLTVSRIANKHASIGVLAGQYDVVYQFLFEAIGEVLGSAVTSEVADAWTEVYWILANSLIEAEKDLYAQAGIAPEKILQPMKVIARSQVTPDVISLTLAHPEGGAVPGFTPGQYISIATVLAGGARQIRQYSITSGDGLSYRVSVKRDQGSPEGEVSNFIHGVVKEGDVLLASPPFGDVTLPHDDVPLVLISAGIGNAPFISMLKALDEAEDTRLVTAVHFDDSAETHAHLGETIAALIKLQGRLEVGYADTGATVESVLDELDIYPDSNVILCGSVTFIEQVEKYLLLKEINEDKIHYEVFGPDSWLKG